MPPVSDLNKNPILVTGGAGFIGSHLVDALISQGESVLVLDDLSTGSSKNLEHLLGSPNIKIITGSVLDDNLVDELVRKSSKVFHLGAAVGVANIMSNPIESFKVNINGTENLLRACLKYGKRIVITSSSEIYGKNSQGALDESSDRILGSPEKFRWLYSEAKAIDETFAMLLHREGLDVRVLRLFNTVGPRQSHKYGMVLPSFVKAANENKALIIHGDGSQTRCFIHVSDVILALLQAIRIEEISGEIFNIGNPEEISILDLAKQVISIMNSSSELKFESHDSVYPEGFEDMARRVPNVSKAKRLLNWQPSKCLPAIIRDTADFYAK